VEAPHSAQAAVAAVTPRPEHIPVRRIRWFDTGLAQVEREGLPTGNIVKFHVPRSHLDDILRTLAIHGPNSRTPQFSVDYESVVIPAVAQAQANLKAESATGQAYLDILLSLKGERVEVSADGRTEHGRLIDVAPWTPDPRDAKDERKANKSMKRKSSASTSASEKAGTNSSSQYELTLLTDAGAIVRVKTQDSLRLRPLDERRAVRLAKALLSRSPSAEQYSPELRIKTDRDEPVTVSYVSELPIPQLNYRLSLASNASKLTGAVLIHNDSDEPWQSVSVQVCNDEPDTFVVPLAAPRYNERALELPASGLGSLLPQLHSSSADMLTTNGAARTPSLGASSPSKSSTSRDRSVTNSSWSPKRTPRNGSVRESYQYDVSVPVSLEAHASALVPFLDTTLKAERGVWLRSNERVGRSIVRLENSTGKVVPAGLLTLFEAGQYAGTAQLPELAPQQKEFVDFGAETQLAAKWDSASNTNQSTIRSVVWDGGTLHVNAQVHRTVAIDLSNKGDRDLSAYITLSVSDDAKVSGADRIENLTLKRPAAAVIVVPAHKQVTRTLVIEDPDEFKKIVESTALPAATRAILKSVYTDIVAVHKLQPLMERNEEEISRIESAIERLPSSSSNQIIATRILQLESQRLGLQQKNVQLGRSKEEKMEGIKRQLSRLQVATK
jgi:hypothetical protein